MSMEKLHFLMNEIRIILDSEEEILTSLHGNRKDSEGINQFYYTDLRLNGKSDQKNIRKYIVEILEKLSIEIENQNEIGILGQNNNKEKILFHQLTPLEKEILEDVDIYSLDDVNINELLRRNYKAKTFSVEMDWYKEKDDELVDEGKIIILNHIKHNYRGKKKGLIHFGEATHIEFIDPHDYFSVDGYMSVIVFLSEKESFAFISDPKYFEDMFDYMSTYKQSYVKITHDFIFIEWTTAGESPALYRQAHELVSFPRFQEVVDSVNPQIIDPNNVNNPFERALKSKEIDYSVNNGNLLIKPSNLPQLKAVLKIYKDEIAETAALGREGFIENLDAFNN